MKELSDQVQENKVEGIPVSPSWNTTAKIVIVVFGVLLVGGIIWRFHDVIPPLIIACLIAYVMTPIVNFVTTRVRISRGMATAAVYLLFVGVIVWGISLLTPLFLRQVQSFQFDFQEIGTVIEEFASRTFYIGSLRIDLAPVYDELAATLTSLVQPLATQTMALLASVVSLAVEALFIVIVSFYLTMDGPKMGRSLGKWVPPQLRYDFGRLRQELAVLWRAFFRGQLLVAVAMGVTLGILMAIVGMKNALILGLLAFFLEFLFSVGHGLWLAIAVILALFQGSLWLPLPNWGVALLVFGIHLVWQQVDLNFFIPRIVGRQVHLHPMVVIIGIIVGGMLGGVLGILLAAPTIASLVVLNSYVYHKLLDMSPWPTESNVQDEKEERSDGDQDVG
ncbi:MAG: AI-2E family transporter [Chloroflexi bacterium]|nr:AI-2E family transporter [Chloroflexota bacterium]